MAANPAIDRAVPLRQRLGLALLVLYGTGITVGAGIYVLIGAVAGHAVVFAPWSFLVAAAVMGLTLPPMPNTQRAIQSAQAKPPTSGRRSNPACYPPRSAC
jgi:hypothetical protein